MSSATRAGCVGQRRGVRSRSVTGIVATTMVAVSMALSFVGRPFAVVVGVCRAEARRRGGMVGAVFGVQQRGRSSSLISGQLTARGRCCRGRWWFPWAGSGTRRRYPAACGRSGCCRGTTPSSPASRGRRSPKRQRGRLPVEVPVRTECGQAADQTPRVGTVWPEGLRCPACVLNSASVTLRNSTDRPWLCDPEDGPYVHAWLLDLSLIHI